MRDYKTICADYVNAISKGKIPSGVYTKKAIQRFIQDLKRAKDADFLFYMDWGAVDEVCSFAETLRPADLNGKSIELLPWQVFILSNLEGWRYKFDQERKRFRHAYVEVNRKNGKTSGILEPLTLYNFIKYPSSESYLVSSRDDLANKTFEEISKIIHADNQLDNLLDCKSLAVTFKDAKESSRLSFFCDGGKDADGFKPRFYCLDEFHAFQTNKMYKSMDYGTRSKKDAQGVIITTADTNTDSPCYAESLKVKKILNGTITQDDYFGIIYAIDETDDFRNSNCWIKANPSLNAIIDSSVIEGDINDAETSPHNLPELKAKTFGVWGGGGEHSWLPVEIWQKNKNVKVNWETFEGCECWGGLDLSQVDDMTAFTLLFRKDGMDFYKHRFYIPEATIKDRYRKENVNIPHWVESGIITAIPGATIDYDFIIRDILEDAETFKIKAIGYDKWQSKEVINGIENERPDIPLVEIEQSLKKLSPITKSYEKTIKDGKLVDNNPVMTWMVNNVQVHPDVNGNYKPMKKSKANTQRIDGVISSMMAHALSINSELNNSESVEMSFDELKALL